VLVEVPVCRRRPHYVRATLALAILAAVTAISLDVWGALVFSIATFDGSWPGRSVALGGVVAVSAALVWLIARMATRHDLGVAYRALWICLPMLALGLLSFFAIVASTPVI
jgi:hypothetical protein